MKILVEVENEIDPTLNVRSLDGNAIAEPGDRLTRVGLPGRHGIDLALGLAGAAVTAFALGPGQEEALSHALAAGAARAVQLVGAVTRDSIARWLAREQPSLVIAGKATACASASLGWAHLAGVQAIERSSGGLSVVRSIGRGDRERAQAKLPAIFRLEPTGRPSYVARARLRAARDRWIDTELLADDGGLTLLEAGPLLPARVRARGATATATAPLRASDRLQALMGAGAASAKRSAPDEPAAETPEAQAELLVRYLAHHHLLETR